jgi:hypothetical protein
MKTEKWNDLLSQTNGLTQPGMVKGILSEQERELFLTGIANVCASFAKANKPYNGLKIFKSSLQDNSQNERFVSDPPLEGEALSTWAKRFFSEDRFGLIMNFLEEYDNGIVEEMSKHVVPLLEKLGTPWAGLSMLFFMGDYGYTPFGVHRGSPGEDGILFHLGPASKLFYIWETEEYNRLTNHANSYHKVEDILQAATLYILEPGDAISFPDDMYHVANTQEFSVSLILDYRRATKTTITETVAQELLKVKSTDGEILAHVSEKELLTALDFQGQSEVAVQRIKLRLASNGGFSTKSRIKPFNLDLAGSYRLKHPFKLTVLIQNDVLLSVFSRGHEITTENNTHIIEVIDKLNSEHQLPISTLGINFNPETIGYSLFEFLMKIGQTDILRLD